jgi:hypothetical protein
LKEIIEIRQLSYGEFSEVSALNPRFKPGGKKLKVVLDVNAPETKDVNADLASVFTKLVKLLPSLERHQCGENLFEDIKSGNLTGDHQHPDQITNIAHMMEHVIIDLQSNITGMNSCSGITCGYKEPAFRFDLFVECQDKKVGMFSAFFAAEVLRRLVSNNRLSRRYACLIDLTKHLYQERSHQQLAEPDLLASQINQRLGWRRSFVLLLLKKLKEFGFLDYKS